MTATQLEEFSVMIDELYAHVGDVQWYVMQKTKTSQREHSEPGRGIHGVVGMLKVGCLSRTEAIAFCDDVQSRRITREIQCCQHCQHLACMTAWQIIEIIAR